MIEKIEAGVASILKSKLEFYMHISPKKWRWYFAYFTYIHPEKTKWHNYNECFFQVCSR